MTVSEALERLVRRRDLDEDEIAEIMLEIMEGRATPAQIGGLLIGLRAKGESVGEIAGAARVMRRQAIRIAPRAAVVLDTCGTGGDRRDTFNISTAAAVIAAAAGVAVAKHGNRAMSGRVGGADVLEALGVRIDLPPQRVTACIDTVGIGFLFAQAFHPAMRYAAAPRRELGIRTIFNLLGPLSNPAGATHQLVGVYAPEWLEPVAAALGRLGSRRALVVHGRDGVDEISLGGISDVAEWSDGAVRHYEVSPADFGLEPCDPASLRVDSAAASASIIRSLLAGEAGPCADIAVLNAAAGLYAAEAVPSIAAGVARAREVIESGAARRVLHGLVEFTNR